jgi:hypothetical protein
VRGCGGQQGPWLVMVLLYLRFRRFRRERTNF